MPKKTKRAIQDELYIKWLGIRLFKLYRDVDQIYSNLGFREFMNEHNTKLKVLVDWSAKYREQNLAKNSINP
jgi:hypothetical protein